MSGSRSPFFTAGPDNGFGAAFGSLAQAFLPDPARTAQAEQRLAATRLGYAQAGRIEDGALAGQRAAARLREAGTNGAAPEVLANIFADVLQSADPELLRALPGFARGVAGAVGAAPDRMAEVSMGAGTGYQDTQVGRTYITDEGNRTSRANAGTAAGATIRSAQIGADARRYDTDQREAGANRRMAPEINPGNVLVVPENSPLASRADPNGRIAAPPSRDSAIASLIEPYVNPPANEPPGVQERRQQLVAPSVAAAEVRNENRPGAQARPVPSAVVRDLASLFERDVTFRDGTRRNPDVPSRRWLESRAAELYQSGPEGIRGNPRAAADEALAEYETAGPVFSGNAITGRASALPPSLARPAPGAAPAAAGAPPAAVPAPAERRVGATYNTPRGPMVWTGTGWRPGA